MRVATLLIAMAVCLAAAGTIWSGKWTSSRNDNGGSIRISLIAQPEVVFTLNDREVKTKVASHKQDEASFSIEYDFELDGYSLRSSLSGTIKGDTAEGTYKTKSLSDGAGVDEGTFQAAVAK
jgi:hypothetical protein